MKKFILCISLLATSPAFAQGNFFVPGWVSQVPEAEGSIVACLDAIGPGIIYSITPSDSRIYNISLRDQEGNGFRCSAGARTETVRTLEELGPISIPPVFMQVGTLRDPPGCWRSFEIPNAEGQRMGILKVRCEISPK